MKLDGVCLYDTNIGNDKRMTVCFAFSEDVFYILPDVALCYGKSIGLSFIFLMIVFEYSHYLLQR